PTSESLPIPICQLSPYLSWSQPYFSLHGYLSSAINILPPSDNLLQIAFVSCSLSVTTYSEMEGFNLKSGPPLIAWNRMPARLNAITITDPGFPPVTS